MPFNKMEMYWNQHPLLQQQNQFYQQPAAPGQFGASNNSQMLNQSLQRFFPPPMTGQGGLPRTSGLGQYDGLGSGFPNPQGNPGRNQNWGARAQSAGAQGYAAPGYPPQGFSQQQPQQIKPMPHQSYPSQEFPSHGYPLQQYGLQGYDGQMPVQPTWNEPPKGGIKGFISNLIAKRKR